MSAIKIIQSSAEDKALLSAYAKKSNTAVVVVLQFLAATIGGAWTLAIFVVQSSAEVLWADSKRVAGTIYAVGLMCDVKALTLMKTEDKDGRKTFKTYPALDFVPGDGDTRFNPKLLHAPLQNQQFVIDGKAYAVTHIEVAKIIAKEFVDEWTKTEKGKAVLKFRGSEEYNAHIVKVAEKFQTDLMESAKEKVPVYAKQFVHLTSEGEVIYDSYSYDDSGSARFVATTVAGETSCAVVGSRAKLGVFKEKDGKKYTHAIAIKKGDQDYSKEGYMQSVAMEQKKRKLHASDEGVETAPCEGEDNTVINHETGVKGVKLPAVLSFLSLQFDGPDHRPRPPLSKGFKSTGGGATRSAKPRGAVTRGGGDRVQATSVAVKGMNVKTGTEFEQTPGPPSMDDPIEYKLRGATCLFVANACVELQGEGGALTGVDDVEVSSEQLQGPLQNVLEMFMGIVDAISKGVGFVSLQSSSSCVKEEDLTERQQVILKGVKSKVEEAAKAMSLSAMFGTSNETWDVIEEEDDVVMKDATVDDPAPKTLEPGIMLGNAVVDPTTGLQISMRLHDGKDDDEGGALQPYSQTTKAGVCTVKAQVNSGLLVRVKVTNVSGEPVAYVPVYVGAEGEEEPEDGFKLEHMEEYELPYPLQKDEGEAPDGWDLRVDDKTVVCLRFNI